MERNISILVRYIGSDNVRRLMLGLRAMRMRAFDVVAISCANVIESCFLVVAGVVQKHGERQPPPEVAVGADIHSHHWDLEL